MFGLGDLFQWERFVTPTVIKVFYWLAVVISILLGFAGAVSVARHHGVQSLRRHDLSDRQPARRLHGRNRGAHHRRIRAHRVPHQRAFGAIRKSGNRDQESVIRIFSDD